MVTLALSAYASSSGAKETVIIGDSLSCGSFGKTLSQNIAAAGDQVHLFCAVSSAPSNWLKQVNPPGQTCQTLTASPRVKATALAPCGGTGRMPDLNQILTEHRGARVIVALGTNSLGSPKADASYGTLAKLIKKTGHACDWVGPPRMNAAQSKGFPSGRVASLGTNLNTFYDSLSQSVDSSCSLKDSRDATANGTPGADTTDGVHRTTKAGEYWATQMTRRLNPSGPASSSAPAASSAR